MSIDLSFTYAAPPDAVLALLTDEQFLRDRAAALGTEVRGVTVVGSETVVRLAVSSRGIPPVFARLVGSSVVFVERTRWTTEGDHGHRGDLDARADVFGRSVQVTGERRLAPEDSGTRSTVTADVTVEAPLIGRRAESAVREMVSAVLEREDELLRRRLA